ncbi:class I SAM-dependent methyltransferase [Paenibacillus sacheonensis]|uniref:Methyltransferase domain-containing protein n=1 Tax=Paenibacillus sacheonensis TaxID=742054 RepID=A0A7X4YN16_9BACL|nr:class I SAM-dependent methyltransferase [Paenibacillus sacheonensis]MBM7564775.1 ubiquinone/menaquinone biosynthesis C-methylase UbiE [Paenibacillus sacheonensis]NBC69327.1 methyltransferase domain-containing protein [Paenibacillus sacheonensis]
MNSKERFSDRVDTYVKYRPSYPKAAIDYLYDIVGLDAGSTVADIGAGTGIFSRLLLERGSRVIAVEPNNEMRSAAVEVLTEETNFLAVAGSAEATTLTEQSVDYIVCAQSFHWFDRAAAQKEFNRILKPDGKAALIWNSRLTEGTPFREGYDRMLKNYATDYEQMTHKNISPADLASFFKAGTMREERFPMTQAFDYEGLKGRLLSSSYAPMPGHPDHEPMIAALRQLFDETSEDGTIAFDYETEVYWGEV